MNLIEFIDSDIVKNRQLVAAIVAFERLHIITLQYVVQLIQKRKARSTWVRGYLTRRATEGQYQNLMRELADEDPLLYQDFIRITETMFNEIVERVRPYIEKKTTFWRKPLDTGLRVSISLRFLARGNSYARALVMNSVWHPTPSPLLLRRAEP